MKIRIDAPIQNPEEDVLGRAKLAESFSQQLLSLDASEGVVVGILGPWGSGKTSFVNLARPHLKDVGITILDFNPWMFSGTEQLVESFFIELSAELKVRPGLDDLGRSLEDYGEIFSGLSWLPLVGPWIERGRIATNLFGRIFQRGKGRGVPSPDSLLAKILQRRKEGVGGRGNKVRSALAALDKPLVVVIDDIDRLTTSEIRDVFKLVRLTASFPKIIYITAFDRARVEDALTEKGLLGRDYLEKILQLGIDLPAVPPRVLDSQVFRVIDDVLSGMGDAGRFDRGLWPDVFVEVIRPLLRNMRDVRRYANAIHSTVRDIKDQVALVDVLALEAVRVFLPDLFHGLHKAIVGLTTTSDIRSRRHEDPSPYERQIKQLINKAGDHSSVARQLVYYLFPAGQQYVGGSHYDDRWKRTWLKERRVAHEDVLCLYLERFTNEGLQAFIDAERAWGRMADGKAFDNYLRSLPAERRQDVISHLGAYEEQFSSEHVAPGSIVLLNLLPELPDRRRGFLDLEPRHTVRKIVYRLVRLLKDPDAIEDAVRGILLQVKKLSAKWELVTMIGHKENAGHKLVPEPTAQRLEKSWRDEVRSATVASLATEKDLLRTFLFVKQDSGPAEPPLEVPDSTHVTCALLQSASTVTRSQGMGSHAVHTSSRLRWDILVDLYGSEEILRKRIEELKSTQPKGLDEILEMADRYLGGWRPTDFE